MQVRALRHCCSGFQSLYSDSLQRQLDIQTPSLRGEQHSKSILANKRVAQGGDICHFCALIARVQPTVLFVARRVRLTLLCQTSDIGSDQVFRLQVEKLNLASTYECERGVSGGLPRHDSMTPVSTLQDLSVRSKAVVTRPVPQ